MFKTIGLWALMNISIIIVITIILAILSHFFGIKLDSYGQNYLSIGIYAAVIGFTGSFISLALSKWMAKKTYDITLINDSNESKLDDKERLVYATVISLARQHGIKIPEVGIYKDSEPNAFATGPSKNNSLVAVSTGLLSSMDKNAIEGVVAHEMAHILNGDMITMTLLQGVLNTFVIFFARIVANLLDNYTEGKLGVLGYFVVYILLQILFGLLASIIAMKFSRYREYKADAGSARYVGKEKMIAGLEALKKIENMYSLDKSSFGAMKISNRKKGGIMQLFSSHPDLDDRIKALEELRV